MTTEDQIVALFAKANPVPSLDVFDPVEPLDIRHLTTRSERSSVMTDMKIEKTKVKGPGRWPRLALAVALPVIAVVALLILVNRNSEVASPQSVATAFMVATAEHDGKAAWELFAPDSEEKLMGLADWTSTYDLDRAIGWDVINQGCGETSSGPAGTLVDCPYLFENDWMRALGIEPTSGNSEVLVADGQIQSVTETGQADESGVFEAYRAFRAFVRENHPEDDATMFGPGDQFLRNPESIPLYEQYTDEFVASASAPTTTTAAPAALRNGVLAAGTYMVTPFAPPGDEGVCMAPPQPGCSESAADDSILITFTVPEGWSGAPVRSIWLTEGENSAPGGAGLIFNRGGWLHSDPCRNDAANPDIPIGPTVDDFANALADHPLLEVTTPVDVTLGGYSGKYVDLQTPADTTGCNFYFVWEPGLYAQGLSQRWHLWILDVDGVRVVVESNDYPGTSAEDRAELEAIVNSIQIEP